MSSAYNRATPREFDSPASLPVAVHASEKLEGWAAQNLEPPSGTQQATRWLEVKDVPDGEQVVAGMGYFTGPDGKENWGVELVDEHSPLLGDESSEYADARFQAQGKVQHKRRIHFAT
jgi:hypothetical protein